jgi:hypothetical protein
VLIGEILANMTQVSDVAPGPLVKNIFLFKKLEYSLAPFRHTLLDIDIMYTPSHCQIWTLIPLNLLMGHFFHNSGKMTKNAYKIIMSLYHSFEDHTIFH